MYMMWLFFIPTIPEWSLTPDGEQPRRANASQRADPPRYGPLRDNRRTHQFKTQGIRENH